MKEFNIDTPEFNKIPIRYLDDILFENEYRGKAIPVCALREDGLKSSAMQNICNSQDYKKAPYLVALQVMPQVYKKTFENDLGVYYGVAYGIYSK